MSKNRNSNTSSSSLCLQSQYSKVFNIQRKGHMAVSNKLYHEAKGPSRHHIIHVRRTRQGLNKN